MAILFIDARFMPVLLAVIPCVIWKIGKNLFVTGASGKIYRIQVNGAMALKKMSGEPEHRRAGINISYQARIVFDSIPFQTRAFEDTSNGSFQS